jgi:hypothetical protein
MLFSFATAKWLWFLVAAKLLFSSPGVIIGGVRGILLFAQGIEKGNPGGF